MADLSKTGKPSSRSRESAYRTLVLAGRKSTPAVLRAALAQLGLVDPATGDRPQSKRPIRVGALRERPKR